MARWRRWQAERQDRMVTEHTSAPNCLDCGNPIETGSGLPSYTGAPSIYHDLCVRKWPDGAWVRTLKGPNIPGASGEIVGFGRFGRSGMACYLLKWGRYDGMAEPADIVVCYDCRATSDDSHADACANAPQYRTAACEPGYAE